MEEMRCPCGGIFQSLGMEYLRTGAVSDGLLFGRDANAWAEGAIPVELFSCDRCRARASARRRNGNGPPPGGGAGEGRESPET